MGILKSSGKLVETPADVPKCGQVIVDTKMDWKRIFAFAK
jgi:hypothetical protein